MVENYWAIKEAKKFNDHPTKGLQQALGYAEKLQINFVYATNGKQIYEFDRRLGKGDYIDNFPTPQELYNRLFVHKNELKERSREVLQRLDGKHCRY